MNELFWAAIGSRSTIVALVVVLVCIGFALPSSRGVSDDQKWVAATQIVSSFGPDDPSDVYSAASEYLLRQFNRDKNNRASITELTMTAIEMAKDADHG